jgi:hypothetical protein
MKRDKACIMRRSTAFYNPRLDELSRHYIVSKADFKLSFILSCLYEPIQAWLQADDNFRSTSSEIPLGREVCNLHIWIRISLYSLVESIAINLLLLAHGRILID